MGFCKNFAWGTATASYQIEGGWNEDGRGLSVWDEFAHDGRSFNGANGDVACDFYHRYREDLDLTGKIGVNAFRYSVSWPRVLPDGAGKISEKGLDFYDRLTDEILKREMYPYLTLYHWDYPLALYKRGGWLNPDSPKWFEEYASIIAQKLGDRVKNWITFNEPACFIGLGYKAGIHAPGLKCSDSEIAEMARNVILAHGLGVKALRENVNDASVGIVLNGRASYPKTETDDDIEAARRAYFTQRKDNWYMNPGFWGDPVILGKYQTGLEELIGLRHEFMTADDLKTASQPIDFFGQNIYAGDSIYYDKDSGFKIEEKEQGFARTAANWPVTEKSLYWAARFFTERYNLPFYVTENGISCHDWVALDGHVHDPNRIDYIHRYLKGLKRAADEGIDVRGYFVWTLLDDFEWDTGYNDRFGLIFVDQQTQKRILKDSAIWYSDVIRTNGETI